MKRKDWTNQELKRAKDRWLDGETWQSIADEMNVNSSTLRKQVQRLYGKLRREDMRVFRDEAQILEAVRLRNTQKWSYGLIADSVSWHASVNALEQAVRRYSRHHELKVYQGKPAKRNSRWGRR
jgi:hypothetical protein